MKGIQGLIVAIGLGIAGALFNGAYLANKAVELDKFEELIAIKPESNLARGDKLTDDKIVPLRVPKEAIGELGKTACYRYSDKAMVIGETVWRNLEGGAVLFRDDLKTPPHELVFGQTVEEGVEEVAWTIPVDPSRFVASLTEPGDLVSFVFPKYRGPTPAGQPPVAKSDGGSSGSDTAEKPAPDTPPGAQPVAGPTEIVGPFKILALGNRLGKSEVMRAAKIQQVQENVVMVTVKVVGGELEPKAQKLWGLLQVTNPQQMGILLHARKR